MVVMAWVEAQEADFGLYQAVGAMRAVVVVPMNIGWSSETDGFWCCHRIRVWGTQCDCATGSALKLPRG